MHLFFNYICTIKLNIKIMARKKLPKGEKIKQIPIHIKEIVLEGLGKEHIQYTAQLAVNKEYLKFIKLK